MVNLQQAEITENDRSIIGVACDFVPYKEWAMIFF
jgi:hypothetical protein